MAQLRQDYVVVAKHFKKSRDWTFSEVNTMFSPQVGRHQYYDALNSEARVHAMLAHWRGKYGFTEAAPGKRAPVAEWLEGINLILFLGEAGKRQHALAWGAQQVRRIQKKKAKQRHYTIAQKKAQKAREVAAAAKVLKSLRTRQKRK